MFAPVLFVCVCFENMCVCVCVRVDSQVQIPKVICKAINSSSRSLITFQMFSLT